MAEISREEVIKNLSLVRASLDYLEIDEELEMAISDMEKVELLEKENAELKEKIKKLESELSWARDEYQMGRW